MKRLCKGPTVEPRPATRTDVSLSPAFPCLPTPTTQGRDELHVDSLAVAEQLAEAGYRPAVYADVLVRAAGEEEARLLPRFDPLLGDAGLGAAGSGRWAEQLHGPVDIGAMRFRPGHCSCVVPRDHQPTTST